MEAESLPLGSQLAVVCESHLVVSVTVLKAPSVL
jgi:hypothetical protein